MRPEQHMTATNRVLSDTALRRAIRLCPSLALLTTRGKIPAFHMKYVWSDKDWCGCACIVPQCTDSFGGGKELIKKWKPLQKKRRSWLDEPGASHSKWTNQIVVVLKYCQFIWVIASSSSSVVFHGSFAVCTSCFRHNSKDADWLWQTRKPTPLHSKVKKRVSVSVAFLREELWD